jgi:hypothetical protein
MSLGRRYQLFRRAAWVALFAFVLQTLLPLSHHPAGMAVAGSLGFSASKNICLAPAQTSNALGNSDGSPAHKVPQCPICQAVQAIGGFVPSVTPAIAVNRDFGTVALNNVIFGVSCRNIRANAQPRGPPSLS